jgi:predicted nucleic acid-binding protein
MNDLEPPKLFLDTSLIIAAMLSENSQSPGMRLFKMAEVRLTGLWVSHDVLRESEGILRAFSGNKYALKQAELAEILVCANVGTTSDPSSETVQECVRITGYRPDARVLAAAIEQDCEVLVAYDKEHLLKNPKIGPPNTRLVVMSGGEALEWAIDQVSTRSRLRHEQGRKRR